MKKSKGALFGKRKPDIYRCKPANKKSSPKQDLKKENFAGNRWVKRATQKSRHRVPAWKKYEE